MILEGPVEIYPVTLDLLTLDKICLTCSLKVNLESKTNPKCH